ncbi:hypothetical protein [Pseudomonas sp. MWU13-2105]|uniref:hypothetical protein n=1 Tax=Pseudomonas sp. MWU13-2105 TaxID=2935074 RepID=UPI00200C9180|nr:hypothetical protein [Pseudomonas sp. MWU13-2105]
MDIKSIVQVITLQKEFRENIVIDCGHTTIFSSDQGYRFGIQGAPSETEILTFKLGVEIYEALRRTNKNVLLNLCLSDLIGIKGGNDERRKITQDLQGEQKSTYIPAAYRQILDAYDVALDRVKVILQSRGNDLFKKILRRTRSGIEQLKAVDPGYVHETFQQTNALFLSTENQGMFSLTTPYLYDTQAEDAYFGGAWWKDHGSINQRDLEHCPLARLKKNPLINLYETGGRVLCPATYGGLLCQFDNTTDHIAVYARSDDEFIGEKIGRGVVAANILIEEFSRNCAQVIVNQEQQIEYSFVEKSAVGTFNLDSVAFIEQVQDVLRSNNMELV